MTLTVTDDADQTDASSQDVTVTEPDAGGISLSVTADKVGGQHHICLSWTETSSENVDVYLDGSLIDMTPDDGDYTHATSNRGQGSYTFQVCEAGTSTCSNEATATY